MRPRYFWLALSACAVAANSDPGVTNNQKATAPGTIWAYFDPSKATLKQRCPGTNRPELTCEAIAAHAAEQQAQWSVWGFLALLATLAGSVWAAWAATKAAMAAEKSAKIADDTARRELRAYLSLRPVEMEELAENGQPVTFTFPVENTGATPANNWILHVAWRVTDENPSSERYDEWLAPFAQGRGEHSIGPHQLKNVPLDFEIPNELRAEVIAAKKTLYLLGDICYTDAFEIERKTEFFYGYNPKLPNRLGQISHRNKIT